MYNRLQLIADSEEQLSAKIEALLKRYPVAGYGTNISEPYKDGDKFIAHASWLKSCD